MSAACVSCLHERPLVNRTCLDCLNGKLGSRSRIDAMGYLEAAWSVGKVPSNYTSLGSYPLIASANDGEAMHPSCVPLLDQYDPAKRRERVVGIGVYWEGPPEQCCHCNEPIESAYGDSEVLQLVNEIVDELIAEEKA